MSSTTPFVHVTVNRFGFNVLDVKINLVNTESPRKTAVMLVALTCGLLDIADEDLKWLEDKYRQSITDHEKIKPEHASFSIGHNLVTFHYVVEKDK